MKARVGHCGAVAKEGFLKLCIITLTRSDHCFGLLRNQPLILLVEKNSFVQFFSLEHDLGNLTSDEAPQRFINRCGVFHSVFSVYRRLQPTWAIPHRLLYKIFYWAQEMFFTGPRCLWGPVYGSRSLYIPPYDSFVKLYWCDSGWWWYQLNMIDDANIK